MCADITTYTTDVTDDNKVSFDYEGYRDWQRANILTEALVSNKAIKGKRINTLNAENIQHR